MSGQNQNVQIQVQKDLVEVFRRLDNGEELGRKELREVVRLIDYVDGLYESGSTSGVEVESSTLFTMHIGKMPREHLWLVYIDNDDSWFRVGEMVVGYDLVVSRNFSEKPKTEKIFVSESEKAARAITRALRLSDSDSDYMQVDYQVIMNCVDFWITGVKTEAFKCVGYNVDATLYIVVSPTTVYTVYTAGGKVKFVTVRNENAIKAFHALFNVPL